MTQPLIKTMKKFCFLILALFVYANLAAQVKVKNLLCENKIDPVGITVMQPRLSWQLTSAKRNVMQTAYEIRVIATLQRAT
jgi:alpha-L-rhamnosidase